MNTTWTATHTPGPWEINEGDGMAIAKVSHFAITAPCTPDVGSGLSREENAANARLIAAAPELLACLRRMCGMYGAYSKRLAPLLAEDEGTVWTFERANGLACEAIAKAEGR
jgi:hypothetical protein